MIPLSDRNAMKQPEVYVESWDERKRKVSFDQSRFSTGRQPSLARVVGTSRVRSLHVGLDDLLPGNYFLYMYILFYCNTKSDQYVNYICAIWINNSFSDIFNCGFCFTYAHVDNHFFPLLSFHTSPFSSSILIAQFSTSYPCHLFSALFSSSVITFFSIFYIYLLYALSFIFISVPVQCFCILSIFYCRHYFSVPTTNCQLILKIGKKIEYCFIDRTT